MKTKKKSLKIILSYFLSLILILLANVGLLNVCKNSIDVYAANLQGSSAISIDNSNFNSNTDSEYPFEPISFTASQDIDTAGVEAGVINLDADDYSSYSRNPLSSDDYVLMIESQGSNVNFGYTTDNNISLSAGSNYSISVDVYTSNNNGIASLYLFDEDNKVFASIDNISSQNVWTTYTFFISTNNIEDLNLKLGLYIKRAGVVLFDNISAYELNDKTLASRMNSTSASTYTYINEVDNVVNEYDVSNLFTGYEFEQGKNTPDYTMATVVNNTDDIEASDGSKNTAFKIVNNQATYAKYATADDFLTLDQNTIYKLTINVKTLDLSGNANLQLVQTNLDDDEEAVDSEVLTITSNTGSSDNLSNNYDEYTFYINSYPTKSTTYKLIVGLGDEETTTTGTLYITNITLTKVNYDTFSSASSGSTIAKIDLTTDYVFSSSEIMLDNGNFNFLNIEDYNNPYPAGAEAWTVSTGEGDQKYGIVNTSQFDMLDASQYTNLLNPTDPDGTESGNNVLMLYNAGNDTLSYTSTAKTLSAKTYHKFTAQVQTQNSPVTLSLVTTKDDQEVVLSSITVETNLQQWRTVEMYIYTGYQELDVSLKITLDSDNYAYAYVDNTMFDYYIQPTEDVFNSITNSATVVKTDLSNIISSSNSSSSTPFSTPDYFTGTDNDSVFAGVVDLENTSALNQVIADTENYVSFTSLAGENRQVLGIRSMEEVYYTYTSNIGFDLTSGSYYRISLSVYTQNLQLLTEGVDSELMGASISLSGFDDTFTQIVSNNTWTTYTFYISPDSDVTTYLQLSLGSAQAGTMGDVFFGNIEFDDSLTSFDGINANDYTKVLNTVSSTTEDDSTDDSTDSTTSPDTNNNWIYYIPTLLFGLAIVIAIVGVLARKIKWKKPHKKSKNEYDRNQTVSRQVYMRKATSMREARIRELKKEIETLTNQRTQYENDYKKDLATLRDMKIKRSNPNDIAKLQKDMKKNQKLSANIGVSIEKLQNEIEYVKSEPYLNNLAKKLASEPSNESTPTQDQDSNA